MTVKPRESFKLKLCLWVVGISTVVFAAVVAACLYFVRIEVRNDLDAVVNAKLDYALRALDEGLSTTKVSSENFVSISRSPLVAHRRDSIYTLMQHFLDANPRIQGVAVGYEPGVVKGHEEGFAPYVMRTHDGYKCRDVAEVKDYRNAEWYKMAKDTGKSRWTKPFYESNDSIIITAYTTPLTDAQGKIYAVAAIDLNLNVMADSLQSLRPYPSAMLTVIDQDGMFVAHPNRDYIMNETMESLIEKADYAPNLSILEDIKAGKRGNDEYRTNDDKMFIYFAPVAENGWTITLEVPRKEIAKGYDKMFKTILLYMVLGVIMLLLVSLFIIDRIAKPLEKFAEAARKIAHGDFKVKLPVVKERNELYDLRAALASMGSSLDKYMSDLEETTKSKATIEGELNIARNIQMAMIPKVFPAYPDRNDVDIHASLVPAKAVGGDLYDFILDGDDFYFCIGDVSGKGVPASLFMAITRTLFRNIAVVQKSPAKIANAMNNAISDGNEENMFVTMYIGRCDLKTGELSFCNCGHNSPVTNGVVIGQEGAKLFIGPSDSPHFIQHAPTNIPIGVFGGFEYQEIKMKINPGVSIFLYTDGVTEAENKNKELYGDDRLLSVIKSCTSASTAREIVERVDADIHAHTLNADQSDDITMLCVRFCPN